MAGGFELHNKAKQAERPAFRRFLRNWPREAWGKPHDHRCGMVNCVIFRDKMMNADVFY